MSRITELHNELTGEIDTVGSLGIARLLRQTDQQLFSGWRQHASIYDDEIQSRVQELAVAVEALVLDNIVKGQASVVVFSGCGTSGRIAWLCARSFNRILAKYHPEVPMTFRYCISGGDESLVISNELPEDDPAAGIADLKRVTQGAQSIIFFGITCGLSAPYVAGQVDWCMQQPHATATLIGFNPVSLARDAPVEGWDKTCRSVFRALEEKSVASPGAAFILNPIVGPEAIAGSSRMKGGSMTKILLDSIVIPALHNIFIKMETGPLHLSLQTPAEVIELHERATRQVYHCVDDLSKVMDVAGAALSSQNDHVYLVGVGSAGLIGLIDASEMVDTYGCRDDEYRAFIDGGWSRCANVEGDMTGKGALFQSSVAHFRSETLATLTERDAVILLGIEEDFKEMHDVTSFLNDLEGVPCPVSLVYISSNQTLSPVLQNRKAMFKHSCVCNCDVVSVSHEPIFGHFALKLLLNAISTGANVIRGAVVGNTMINLTVSNNKLFHRSAEIVASVAQCDVEHAKECLLRVIYNTDALSDEIKATPLSVHIEKATPQRFVVPTAILVASAANPTVSSARQLLTTSSSLSHALKSIE
eukprot:m.161685 g.161685  ORF g.161685 m.161685 type:complete len:589 (-) comp14364_c1_seq9:299-2065(-)